MDDTASTAAAGGAAFGPWGALAGAVLGGILGAQQKKEQQRTRKEQAMINMYAPLFGKSPEAIGMDHNYTTTGIMQGGMSGYALGSSIDRDKRKAEQDARESAARIAGNSANPNTSLIVPTTDAFAPYAQPKAQAPNFQSQFGLPFNPYGA